MVHPPRMYGTCACPKQDFDLLARLYDLDLVVRLDIISRVPSPYCGVSACFIIPCAATSTSFIVSLGSFEHMSVILIEHFAV